MNLAITELRATQTKANSTGLNDIIYAANSLAEIGHHHPSKYCGKTLSRKNRKKEHICQSIKQ